MGSSSIQVFSSREFGELRALRGDDGEPWFVAKDVCDFLEITNRNRAMQRLDEDEKGGTHMYTPGGKQEVRLISEAGFYNLLFLFEPTKANKATRKQLLAWEAKVDRIHRFKRWVTHDVLPAIRKSGGYIATDGTESNEELLARAVLVAQDAIKRKDARIAQLEPKARFADAVSAADGTCLVGELAKMLRQNGVEVGQNRLFEWLRVDGYLGRFGSNYNVPTQRAMELGLFRIKETAVHKADGSVTISRTPKVTGKGQTYFFARYAYGNEEPTL